MSRSVALVEVPLYPNTLPLASGYLQAYAQQDPRIAEEYSFVIHSRAVSHPERELIRELVELDCEVYAMSCYLWNMRRISVVLAALREARPSARFILGGPQVMNRITEYIDASMTDVVVADSEGEIIFSEYLRELLGEDPDLARVPGISFWRDGTLVTTPAPDRIKDLDEIPSPFAAGVFDGADYAFAVVETNRGCPFRCSYCYWGAATNDKVHRWELTRVRDDLTWLSEHGVESIFLADANWGALPRDVELTRHLVECKQRNGYPMMVSMQAAKNRPDRVTDITEILVAGGMLTSQPVSLQTVSPATLAMVDRSNIKESTYVELQQKLHEKEISSYTELIWPLPGETLDSFREGIGKLCRIGADVVVTYPQLLLPNTPMERQAEVLGIKKVRVNDSVSEADVVVETKWVNRQDYELGLWFYYAVVVAYNARGAYYTARYLDSVGDQDHETFLENVARWFRAHADTELCAFLARSIATLDNYDINNVGKVLHMVMHSHRAEVDRLLRDYVRSLPRWREDPLLRSIFEIDLLARPYVYREPLSLPDVVLDEVAVTDHGRYHVTVDAPRAAVEWIGVDHTPDGDRASLVIDHRGRRKMPYPRHRDLDHNASYCQAMMNRMRDILPQWRVAEPARPVAG